MENVNCVRSVILTVGCVVTLLLATPAMADRYQVVELGDSPVSYIEHRSSVNDSSQVAWTQLVGANPRARLTDASNPASLQTTDLHALLTSFGNTYATDFISRAEDINNRDDVVGYSTNTPLEFRRHAALWLDNGTSAPTVIDLHAALEAHPTLGGQYDMTAAYGISERIDGDLPSVGGEASYVFVAGYGRTSLSVGSVPLVWGVNADTGTVFGVYAYGVGPQSGQRYGILYDVAVRELVNGQTMFVAGGGVGGQASGQAYLDAFAVEQNLNTGAFTTFAPTGGQSSGTAASGINRVEILGGTMYAAGYALATDGTAEAFVWNYDEFVNGNPNNSINVGGGLSQGDVAIGMGLGLRTDGASVPNQPQIVGASTVSAGAIGDPNANSQSALAGFHAYIEASTGASLDRTCDLNAELPSVTNAIEVATDMNSSGVMVGWSGVKAVITVPIAANSQPNFRTKITPIWNFWYVELPETVSVVGGGLVISDEPGCSSLAPVTGNDPCDGLSLNVQDQGFADVYDVPGGTPPNNPPQTSYFGKYNFGFPAYPSSADFYNPTGPIVAISKGATWINDNGLGVDTQNNSPLPTSGFLQLYARTNDGRCLISDPVDLTTVNFEQNVCEDRRVTQAWGIGAGIYKDCIQGGGIRNNACETDVMNTSAHCGACGVNVDDGLSCTTNTCVAGAPSLAVNANMCLIGGSQCYTNGQDEILQSGAGGRETAINQCRECASGANNTGFTPVNGATCCSGGNPVIDSWERQSGGSITYRPARPNVSYTAANQSANWMKRIRQVDDQDIWMDFQNGGGDICWYNGDPNFLGGVEGPRRLTSSLNGTSDREDWYVFRHEDKNTAGLRIQEPRARARGLAGQQVKLCMYWLCPGGATKDYGYESKEGLGISKVSPSNSPIGTTSGGLRGLCQTSAAGGATDIELYFEDTAGNGCNGSGSWNPDIFLQVSSVNPSAVDCNDRYELYWGNDVAARSAGSYQTTTRTPSICDGQGVVVTP